MHFDGGKLGGLLTEARVTPACLKYVFHAFVCGARSADNRMVCFRRKAFLKSDTVAGLTRS